MEAPVQRVCNAVDDPVRALKYVPRVIAQDEIAVLREQVASSEIVAELRSVGAVMCAFVFDSDARLWIEQVGTRDPFAPVVVDRDIRQRPGKPRSYEDEP